MALVPCKECGTEISTNAPVCPKCGTPWPASYMKAFLTFQRKAKFAGIGNMIKISIDNQYVGELASGGKFNVEIDPGTYVIQAVGTVGGKTEVPISVESGKEYTLNASSEFGVLHPSIKISIS